MAFFHIRGRSESREFLRPGAAAAGGQENRSRGFRRAWMPCVLPGVSSLLLVACLETRIHAADASPGERPVSVPSVAVPILPQVMDADGLAAVPSGQTAFVIDRSGPRVVGFDTRNPAHAWTAVDWPEMPQPESYPFALGCIDTNNLAILCREKTGWSIRVCRLKPSGESVAVAEAAQCLPLREATDAQSAGSTVWSQLVVGREREWLLVTGLPDGAERPVSIAIRGGALALGGPKMPGMLRGVVSVAAAPMGVAAFVQPAVPDVGIRLRYYAPEHAEALLDLDTGLPRIRAAAFGRGDSSLWAIGGESGSTTPEGLWRLDAVLVAGRQTVRASLAAEIKAPRSLCPISEQLILVTAGSEKGRVVAINPRAGGDEAVIQEQTP